MVVPGIGFFYLKPVQPLSSMRYPVPTWKFRDLDISIKWFCATRIMDFR